MSLSPFAFPIVSSSSVVFPLLTSIIFGMKRFGTAAVVRGLKEAGEDESIGAVVLRIDSGGGGVVDSDTIWGAVRDLRERKGKTVVASFGNASASGGYLVSTHTDAIFAARKNFFSLSPLFF